MNQTLLEKARELQIMNDRFCDSEEIFRILDGLEKLEAEPRTMTGRHESSHPSELAPVFGSQPQIPLSMEKLAIKMDTHPFESPFTMKSKQPSKLDAVGHIQTTKPPEMDIYQIVDKAFDLIEPIMILEEVPKHIQVGFEIERYRLVLLAEPSRWKEHANKATTEVNYLTFFEDHLFAIVRRFEVIEDNYKKTGYKNNMMTKGTSFELKDTPPDLVEGNAELNRLNDSLSDILKSFCVWNNSFETLCGRLEYESIRRKVRLYCSTELAKYSQQAALLQKAAAYLRHVDIQNVAQAIEVVYKAKRGQTSDDLAPYLGYDSRMESTKIKPLLVAPSEGETRPIVEYDGSKIIIDWYEHDASNSQWETDFIRHRTEFLAGLLNVNLQAMGLSVLHCVGYIQIKPNLTGFGFRLPREISPRDKPITLQDLLDQWTDKDRLEMPDLGERFDLARALVNTMFELSTMNWAKYCLLPRNILFWPREDGQGRWEIRKPYLVGFHTTIFSQPGGYSKRRATRPDDDYFYRTRSLESMGGRDNYVTGLYSLGVVLLDVGLWRSTSSLVKERGKERFAKPLTPIVLREAAHILRTQMGSRYTEAATACIAYVLKELPPVVQSDWRKDYLQYFQNKVVDVIAQCSA